jgi:hypothetical protein
MSELTTGWDRVAADGPAPFVTREVLRREDGTTVTTTSRDRR